MKDFEPIESEEIFEGDFIDDWLCVDDPLNRLELYQLFESMGE